MNNITDITGYSFTLGYIDGSGHDFSLASGPRSNQYFPVKNPGNMSADD
jgi:hypothetical protein